MRKRYDHRVFPDSLFKHLLQFLRVATVGELVIDLGREFQIFGPRYRSVNCLILVLQKCHL